MTDQTTPAPRAVGFVGLAGRPNVGKSTLLNRLVGQKISIVSDRPQTTREQICGIYTDAKLQAVLVDVPGIIPNDADTFNQSLMHTVATALAGCDLVLHMRDARRPGLPEDIAVGEMIRATGKPVWLVWNKVDAVRSGRPTAAELGDLPYARIFSISAKTGRGVPDLLAAVAEVLPVGPLLYDADQVCDRDLRFLAAEMVREKLFRYLGQEIPYGTIAVTEQFDEDRAGKAYLRITIVTDRQAHKPIILGHGGAMLKKIGQAARRDIEQLLEREVYLELFVKVTPKWRRNSELLREFGLKQR